MRSAFESGCTRPIEFRENQLKCLLKMYKENQKQFLQALQNDLNKVCLRYLIQSSDFLFTIYY